MLTFLRQSQLRRAVHGTGDFLPDELAAPHFRRGFFRSDDLSI